MSPKAPSPDPEVLPCVSEKCVGCEAELERTQLHALLCKHEEEQASESRGLFGEKS